MAAYTKQRKVVLAAFKDVFESPNGQVVLKEYKSIVGQISFVKGDPYQTAFNEGRRDLYERTLALIAEANQLERRSHGRTSDSTESDTTEQYAANEPGTTE